MATMRIPVPKAKGEFIDFDTATLSDEMYAEAVFQGLKQMFGRGFSKIGKAQYPVEAELKAAAIAKAQENAKAVSENDTSKIKLTSDPSKSSTAKLGRELSTEVMRLARNIVRDEMRKEGLKPSHYKASEITRVAKLYIENDPTILDMAKKNLEDRANVKASEKLDLKTMISADPILIRKAEEKKAKAKGSLSATQAGKPATRAKPAKAAPAQATLQ